MPETIFQINLSPREPQRVEFMRPRKGVLSVGVVDSKLVVWLLVDTGLPGRNETIHMLRNGDAPVKQWDYIGTGVLDGTPLHVFME